MNDRAIVKIGFLSLPITGHLNPMAALARKLQSRGHEIVFIGVPDIEPVVRAAGLDFVPICENEYPPGSVAKSWGGVAKLHGLDLIRYTDFPIPRLPRQFHYAGPFQDNQGREPVPFPWDKFTGKPLIYASMGTLVNGLRPREHPEPLVSKTDENVDYPAAIAWPITNLKQIAREGKKS
jgi:UDP:flavonoid glycosyltransferase YjiC (YdhE family)